jgi:hydrogenase maturation protease
VHGVLLSYAGRLGQEARASQNPMTTIPLYLPRRTCVIGVGNILLGDDGFGPLTVEMFRCTYVCDSNVTILDLGTPGLDVAPYMYDANLLVLVDAVQAEKQPGTLCVYSESDLSLCQAQLRLSSHDPGIFESLVQLRLSGHAPSEVLIVGAVPECCTLGSGVSSSVLRASSVAIHIIAGLLSKRAVVCRQRPAPTAPNLWWLSPDRRTFVPEGEAIQGRTHFRGAR